MTRTVIRGGPVPASNEGDPYAFDSLAERIRGVWLAGVPALA